MAGKPAYPISLYRFFKGKGDFEGVHCTQDGSDLVINWFSAGSGQLRSPVATVHNGRIIVTWEDLAQSAVWVPPVRVVGAIGWPVVLAKG